MADFAVQQSVVREFSIKFEVQMSGLLVRLNFWRVKQMYSHEAATCL
jgi:hypothetical protein